MESPYEAFKDIEIPQINDYTMQQSNNFFIYFT